MATYTETTADISTPPGKYVITASFPTAGTVTLSYKVGDLQEENIEDASWSVAATKRIDLPLCLLTVTITGGGEFNILRLPN